MRPIVLVGIGAILLVVVLVAIAYAGGWGAGASRGGGSGAKGPGAIPVVPVNDSFNLSGVLAGGDIPLNGYGFCGPSVEYDGKLPASASGTILAINPSNVSEVRLGLSFGGGAGGSSSTLGSPGSINGSFTDPPGGTFYVTMQPCDPFAPGPNDTVSFWLNFTAPGG